MQTKTTHFVYDASEWDMLEEYFVEGIERIEQELKNTLLKEKEKLTDLIDEYRQDTCEELKARKVFICKSEEDCCAGCGLIFEIIKDIDCSINSVLIKEKLNGGNGVPPNN